MLLWRFGEPSSKKLGIYEFMAIMTPTTLEGNAELAKKDPNLNGGYDTIEQSHYIYTPGLYPLIRSRNVHFRNQ